LPDARMEYESRLADRSREVEALETRDNRIANERMGVFIVGCALAIYAYRSPVVSVLWLAIPAAYFVWLMVRHERTLRQLRRARAGVRFYTSGLARLNEEWHGRGSSGDGLFPDDHPYAADLDLYGEGSLFELLCTTRTRAGEQRLADWLATAADPITIRARNGAIDELRSSLDLREALARFGDENRTKVHPRELIEWANAEPVLPKRFLRPIASVVGVLGAASLLGISLFGPAPLLITMFAAGAILGLYAKVAAKIFKAMDRPSRELGIIVQVIRQFEEQSFQSDLLVQLQTELRAAPSTASTAIAKLHRVVYWTESLGNMMLAPFAFLLVLPIQFGYQLEQWRKAHGPEIERWLDALGELEALLALSCYAYEHPNDPFPELAEAGPLFVGDSLKHPLIPESECVSNSVRLDGETKLFIVSGSNMSGKSTLLRSIGINVVLAQAGAPVRAKGLTLSPCNLGATLRIQDSIHLGRSRFYAEIAKLGELAKMGTPERPLLFLLDELLHGTNSHDRAIGGEAVLKQFVEAGGIGLVTTHDVSLTGIESKFDGHARNIHFRDEVVDGELRFDYTVHSGPVQKGNALELMRAVGLQV